MVIKCPIKRKEYARQAYLRNRDKILAECKSPENAAKRRENQKAWKSRNRDKVIADKAAYRKARAERDGKKYRSSDQIVRDKALRDEGLAKKRLRRLAKMDWERATAHIRRGGLTEDQYKYKKHREIPANIVALRMRVGIRKQLSEYEGKIRWQDVLGYTAQQLADHIESLFAPNMTWELLKTGRIHLDHIKPKSLFSYASPYDPAFKECWAMSNLQPLWAEENRAKGNYYEEMMQEQYNEEDYEMKYEDA